MSQDTKIVIVGPGAMGCFFAARLSAAGHEVWLLARTAHQAGLLNARGLVLEDGGSALHIPWQTATDDAARIGMADVVLLCVKAYDTEQALHSVMPAVGSDTAVVTLQNGIGHTDLISGCVDPVRIVAGTTAHGATRITEGHVRHAGTGETVIGGLHPSARCMLERVQRLFTGAGIQTAITQDIHAALWGKLIINAAINPLTAIFRIPNGVLAGDETLQALVRSVVSEACGVAARVGIRLPYPDPLAKVFAVCRATAANISSMHQDVRAGRQTEIDAINGAIVRSGRAHGVPTPVNSLLVDLVTAAAQLRTPRPA